jgi:hypothetical protein
VDAIPPGCDDAPAFVLRHGVGHDADANCHVGISAMPALRYRRGLIAIADRLSEAARPSTEQKYKQNSGNWKQQHRLRRAIRMGVASIKMSGGNFDDACKNREQLASRRSAGGAGPTAARDPIAGSIVCSINLTGSGPMSSHHFASASSLPSPIGDDSHAGPALAHRAIAEDEL